MEISTRAFYVGSPSESSPETSLKRFTVALTTMRGFATISIKLTVNFPRKVASSSHEVSRKRHEALLGV